jgi:hypothetical protein
MGGFEATDWRCDAREDWWKARQTGVDRKHLVFIDETWVKTNMEPLRGWGPRDTRLKAQVPYGHWKTMTFLATLRHDRIDAPWVIDRPMANSSELMSRRSLPRPLPEVTSSCSIIWVAPKESRHAPG